MSQGRHTKQYMKRKALRQLINNPVMQKKGCGDEAIDRMS